MPAGQPLYLGTNEITELYLGTASIGEAYLGTVQVFSSGPFQGLKISPTSFSFNSIILSKTLKVKASENWTMTVPDWITADVLTGGSGITEVQLTTTVQSATTTGTISLASANYSASATAAYYFYTSMDYIYESNSSSYEQTHRLDTGIAHTASTMTIEIEYYGLGGNSDRMVGYQEGDPGCLNDNNDFRLFGYSDGTLDYMIYRNSFGNNYNSGYHHCIIGDCFCYDVDNETYLVKETAVGSIPSSNCHIYVDVSYIKVKSLKIADGNNVLFDGVAAELGGSYGLFDMVSGQLITNTDITVVGE